MSHSKFAPITSSLLVRKGEASPSPAVPTLRPVAWISETARKTATESAEPRFVYKPEESTVDVQHGEGKTDACHANEKPRRIVLNLTAQEYETLGLVAVKKGSSRHKLAQGAIDAYFEWLVSEFGEACTCIAGGALCRCECGTH
jgi:hypothetical protein